MILRSSEPGSGPVLRQKSPYSSTALPEDPPLSHSAAPSSRIRRYLPWLVLVLGLLGFLYALAGVAMAGSFQVADGTPAGHEYWWRVALIYEIIAGACLLVCVGAVAVLIPGLRGRI